MENGVQWCHKSQKMEPTDSTSEKVESNGVRRLNQVEPTDSINEKAEPNGVRRLK